MSVVPYERPQGGWGTDPASTLEVAARIANEVGGTDFVPQGLRGNPAAITAALMYGAEIGLKPMRALAMIAMVNGRPAVYAEANRALLLAAGHDLWIEESTITRCTVCGRRKGSDAVSRVTWTIDDAKRAGLAGKQPWRMYPRQMLQARATAELARLVFPDAIGGLAVEELDDEFAPEPVGNGVVEQPAKTTRRRRASVNAPATTPPPPAPAEPELPPLPGEDDSPAPAPVPPVTPAGDREPAGGADQPAPDLMTAQQRKLMMKLFTEKGFTERTHRLAFSSAIIRRRIQSSEELTRDEASQLIDALQDPFTGLDEPAPEP